MRAVALAALIVAPAAWAADGVDSTTTIGVDAVYAPAVGGGDANLLLGQRLRWSPATAGPVDVRVVADGRFRLDALKAPTIERAYVSRLGVELTSPRLSVRLGRHPVTGGGALVFDGAEVLYRAGAGVSVGAWGGASPDRFTSRPEARFGGGPIVSWIGSSARAALVGEALFAAGGLDRASLLATASLDGKPGNGVAGRLDVQVADPDGRIGVADGLLTGRIRAADGLDVDALYEVYSSVRYLRTTDRDPTVSRFAERSEAALGADVPQDAMDPTTYHLGGAGLRWLPPGDGPTPTARVVARYRWHEDPSRRLLKVAPSAGAARLLGQRLDVGVDGTLLFLDEAWRGDVGAHAILDPLPSRSLRLDASAHVLIDAAAFSDRLGWAADGFVDWVGQGGWVLSAGVEWSHEPWTGFPDVGYRGFLIASKRFAPPRGDRSGSAP